jgi:uncharacterized protein (TIGR00369 family)
MSGDEHFRKLERMYHGAPCNEYYAPTLTVSEGESRLVIPVQPKFFHAAHATHGSVYFKALDDAAYFAVNSLVDDVIVLTASFHVHLIRPVSEGEIWARGRVIHGTHQLFFAESELEDSEGRLLAKGTGSFARSRIPLSPEIGYR